MAGQSAGFDAVSEKSKRYWCVVCVVVLFLLAAGVSEGARWYVDENAAGDENGNSWPHAFKRLQGALASFDIGDEIWVAEGTYTADVSGDFTISKNAELYGGFVSGQADPGDRDISSHPTILTNANNIEWSVVLVSADVLLDGFTIISGDSPIGGGGIFNSGFLTVRNCTLSDNKCTFLGGGGICNTLMGSRLIVENSTFSNNTAEGVGGGGIFNILNASLTAVNCTFSDNKVNAVGGGGICSAGASVVLVNCTFSDNDNTAPPFSAKGLYYAFNGFNALVRNCIFWGGTDQIESLFANQVDVQYSVVQGGVAGVGNIDVNPNLAPLANNGGATRTHALPAGSSAIDQGQDVGTVVSGVVAVPSHDQRGVARPLSRVDIGAYERVVTPGPTPDPDPTPSPPPRPTPYPIQPVPHPKLISSKTAASDRFVLTDPTPLTVVLSPDPTRESMKAAIRNALRVVLGFPDELAEDFAENSLDKVDDARQPYMSDRVRERLKELLPDLEITAGTPSPPLALFLARLNSGSSVTIAEEDGAIALAFFGPLPSVFVGKNAERLRVVKALTSASVTPFVQAFAWDEFADGCSSIVEVEREPEGSILKRVLGRNDAVTKNCLVVIAVRDGGAFDLDGTENGRVSDPAFLLEAEPPIVPSPTAPPPVQGGGGGCSAGGTHFLAVCILLLPLLALRITRKR